MKTSQAICHNMSTRVMSAYLANSPFLKPEPDCVFMGVCMCDGLQ